LNDIGRNFLLGNRKKIAKCLMPLYLLLYGRRKEGKGVLLLYMLLINVRRQAQLI
jgi:hypothetical protein